MADWPDLATLQARLNESSDDLADAIGLQGDVDAAIAKVKKDVGLWDEYEDVPDDSLSRAALRMAELIATRPEAQLASLARDATYRTLLSGHRRRFGFA